MSDYDSRIDTLLHIKRVSKALSMFAALLLERANVHDESKLSGIEKEAFDVATPKLRGLTYGSEEYRASLREIKPAIQAHYAANSHHPEHYVDGISGFDLLDLVEMYCDWIAAIERHDDGDIMRSIEINDARFGMGDQLKSIFKNTASRHFL